MLSCRQVANMASRALARELSWRERVGLQLHLWLCVHCRRFMRQMALLVRGLFAHAHRNRAPEKFVDQVMSKIADRNLAANPVDPHVAP